MRTVETIQDMRSIIRTQKKAGKTIGFVPTMGYLHEGHMSLVKASTRGNDFTVMSIYVNPTQFGANEDYTKYPRDLDRDSAMAEAAGVDVIFAPSNEEMYPEGYKTYVQVEDFTDVLCGKSRPGHFKGVTTIVSKLFHIVEPDHAYFGQKDAQQLLVIQKMVQDMNMNLEVIGCPIIRENDGLAMSSRNVYLKPEERQSALVLSQSLFEAEAMIQKGERSRDAVYSMIKRKISGEKHAQIDYIEIRKADDLKEIDLLSGRVLIALAVKFGATRLIDNLMVEV